MKKIKVVPEGPMYTLNNFHTYVCVCTCKAAKNVKGALCLHYCTSYSADLTPEQRLYLFYMNKTCFNELEIFWR